MIALAYFLPWSPNWSSTGRPRDLDPARRTDHDRGRRPGSQRLLRHGLPRRQRQGLRQRRDARAGDPGAVARTGYVVNRQAQGLAGGRSQVVGLVVPDLDTSYIGEIVRGIDEELAAVSYDLMLYTTHHRKHRESAFVATLTAGLADGLLLVLPADPGAYLDSIRRRGFPYVLIDHGGIGEDGPSVGATNQQGAYDATSYLIGLGHRRIGFITGNMDMGCAIDRLAGYRAALDDHGLAVRSSPDPRRRLPSAARLSSAPGSCWR